MPDILIGNALPGQRPVRLREGALIRAAAEQSPDNPKAALERVLQIRQQAGATRLGRYARGQLEQEVVVACRAGQYA